LNAPDEVTYRLALAEGFLAEAEQDIDLKRWRSCVDNAQLTVENAGKAILASFGVAPKTHDPARQVAALVRKLPLPEDIQQQIRRILPDLLALGTTEHFLTDYGDEATYTLPWDLFTQEAAQDALAAARRSN
jgi:HEPN domain-containing protein